MPLKIMKKEFLVKQIEVIANANKAFNRVSWVVIFESEIPIFYQLENNQYKSRVLNAKDWENNGDLEDLEWHVLAKMPLKIKSSEEDKIKRDLDFYVLMPEFNFDKIISLMGASFLRFVNRK